MADKSGIIYTDASWNPITGCTKVSPACRNCYAEREWPRLTHLPIYQGRKFTDVACHAERLDQPIRWKRPRKIFVNALSDLFHEAVPDDFIDQVFAVMAYARHHQYQLLTKRPERMLRYLTTHNRAACWADAARKIGLKSAGKDIHLPPDGEIARPLENLWLGVTVENQETANERLPLLLKTPAAIRWISVGPMLGKMDLTRIKPTTSSFGENATINVLTGATVTIGSKQTGTRLDWVVVEGESGPKARPMHPEWPRMLRDQCEEAGVAYLFKQWGEWAPIDPLEWDGKSKRLVMNRDEDLAYIPTPERLPETILDCVTPRWSMMQRVGTNKAGRLLDGVEWNGYPQPST